MARKYECDRCSQQFNNPEDIGQVEYPLLDYQHGLTSDIGHKDLCTVCVRQLHEFLNPLPKQRT